MREDELVAFLKGAIRIPSLSGQEGDMVAYFKNRMLALGFDSVQTLRYGSIVGHIKGSRPGKRILFDGHIDTVPVVDGNAWTHDPFGGEVSEGKVWGRGTSDMKGGDCAMIAAVGDFAREKGRGFAGDLFVSCTVQEERFEGVSSREVSSFVRPDCVIIGEATDLKVNIGQRGRAEIVVETEGKSCHSSNPEKGVNAVYGMMEVVEELGKRRIPEHPLLGKGILELTDIISSPYPGASVVPRTCTATFDRRVLVGEDEQSILDDVRDAVLRVKKQDPKLRAGVRLAEGEAICLDGEKIEGKRYFAPWIIDRGHPLVVKARKGLRSAGLDDGLSHYSFCTNGSHFAGEARIPTIGYGPSQEPLAHIRDEYIEISQLFGAYKGYKAMLEELTR